MVSVIDDRADTLWQRMRTASELDEFRLSGRKAACENFFNDPCNFRIIDSTAEEVRPLSCSKNKTILFVSPVIAGLDGLLFGIEPHPMVGLDRFAIFHAGQVVAPGVRVADHFCRISLGRRRGGAGSFSSIQSRSFAHRFAQPSVAPVERGNSLLFRLSCRGGYFRRPASVA